VPETPLAAVWFDEVSDGVWVPAIGAVPPPQRDQLGRQLALVAGHLVCGVVLAEGLHGLRDLRRARQRQRWRDEHRDWRTVSWSGG
jgi:hypothetical protein